MLPFGIDTRYCISKLTYWLIDIWILKGTLVWDFFVLVFCTYQTHIGQIVRLLNFFNFVLKFAGLFKFFNIWRWLSWHGVSFLVNWVNAKWNSTSTESTRNNKIFVNVGVFCVDSVDMESLCVDSVDMKSHSMLTQLRESLTPRRLSVREMNQAKTGIHNRLWRL